MFKDVNYYYKGYDIENNSRLEKLRRGYSNPYDCNIGSNFKRVIDYQKKVTFTSQDNIKLKLYK